ncbi:hypothetical protein GCM10022223_43000 [Kineosporia mesophila]|uniref:Tellurite resistance protein TerB n=1 Tax=Kineosporia mesophila TaxID=566012 RepID=A0ABP6ZZK4_9ACTN|nr:hypothetical protein [Kineosporia mesophila]MCD5353262.1 hypothetical protein [Kineosporia mesophila]
MAVNGKNVRALISAFLPMRRQELGTLLAGLSEDEAEDDLRVAVAAAGGTVVFHLFVDTEEPLDWTKFQEQVVGRLRGSPNRDPQKVEAVVRGLAGDTRAFDGISEDDRLEISLAVLESATALKPAAELAELVQRASTRAVAMGTAFQTGRST